MASTASTPSYRALLTMRWLGLTIWDVTILVFTYVFLCHESSFCFHDLDDWLFEWRFTKSSEVLSFYSGHWIFVFIVNYFDDFCGIRKFLFLLRHLSCSNWCVNVPNNIVALLLRLYKICFSYGTLLSRSHPKCTVRYSGFLNKLACSVSNWGRGSERQNAFHTVKAVF